MPVHDWTRVSAGLFHAFHQSWITALSGALNRGVLPPDYFALPEQRISGPIPSESESDINAYAHKADRITVRHEGGRIVAVVEIVSPGNKGSTNPFRSFVEKTSGLIAEGIHVFVIDLFPPSKRDPQGIHKAIWDQIEDVDFDLPADKPLVLAAYKAGLAPEAFVDLIAVEDVLPDMPIFLEQDHYVPAPLEATYQTAWNHFPTAPKGRLEPTSVNPPGNL